MRGLAGICLFLLLVVPAAGEKPVAPLPSPVVTRQTAQGAPTSLDELVHAAAERTLSLLSGRLSSEMAAAELEAEKGAFDPAFRAFAGGMQTPGTRTRTFQAGISKALLPLGTEVGLSLQTDRLRLRSLPAGQLPDYTTHLDLTLTQPLLEGVNQAGASIDQARLDLQAAEKQVERLLEQVVAQVEWAYWALAEAEAVEEVSRKSLIVADSLFYRNVELHKRELISELDVLTAESGVALRRASWIEAQRRRLEAAESLVFLVYGEEAAARADAATRTLRTAPRESVVPELPSLGDAQAEALASRPDVRAARLDFQRAGIGVEVAKNKRLPDLSLQAGVGLEGMATNLGDSFDSQQRKSTWSMGLVLSHRLLVDRTDEARYRQFLLSEERKRLALVQVEQEVKHEVRQAVRGIVMGKERLEAAEQAAFLAQRQLEAEKKRLDLGLSDPFRVLEVEENAAAAGLAAARARFALAREMTSYKLAMGRIRQGYFSED